MNSLMPGNWYLHVKRMVLIWLASLLLSPGANATVTDDETRADPSITIVNHGWHVGIIVPAAQAEAVMPFLQERFYQAQYYEFGWGDQGFYQADEITLPLILRALFVRTATVMHVVSIRQPPSTFFTRSEQVSFRLDEQSLHKLLSAIRLGFASEENNLPIALRMGIYGDSHFYRGSGKYHVFNTCNSWVADVLQQGGFKSAPWFDLTATAIMRWVRKLSVVLERESKQAGGIVGGLLSQAVGIGAT